MPKDQPPKSLPAIRVRQWLKTWDEAHFDDATHRRKPEPHFYILSIPAQNLRALSGIYRRTATAQRPRHHDLGIQRRHNPERSEEISEYVQRGFPWSALSKQRRKSGEFDDLVKPGWLPTSIVVNILRSDDEREGEVVHNDDLVSLRSVNGQDSVILPKRFGGSGWRPKGLPPIEIIDGQHRLWAFAADDDDDDFEVPVVAFHGLDLSWQAYLFYTINIKPKKINTSLAFDLYPLLRTEDWLERFSGSDVYKQSRAQELTEALWSYPKSPWHNRIDMLGEKGRGGVSQAAWVRNLLATYVKSYEGKGVRIGGLFGAALGEHHTVLPWTRSQQSAFLIYVWQQLQNAISASKSEWASSLRDVTHTESVGDSAFSGSLTLLNTDQGVRGLLAVTNDLCWIRADQLQLTSWATSDFDDGTSEIGISNNLSALARQPVAKFIKAVSASLAEYDWRTSAFPGLSTAERNSKARFRGGTGYKELRRDLLVHLSKGTGEVKAAAIDLVDAMDR